MEVKQSGNTILTRWYPGGNFIRETAGGVTKDYTFIGGDTYSAPVVAITQSGTTTYYNLLRDHLGSITHVVNASNNTLLYEYSYDSWGRMRNVSTWTDFAPGSEPSLFVAGRGFTGHEHLPWFNLINMNGRVYDPLVGQFLSPDNHVQAPYFTQSLNRYVYCLNNPLKYTDPSGEKLKWWQLGFLDILTGGVVSLTATSLITTEVPTWTANAVGLTYINSFSGQDRVDNTWDIWKGLFKTNSKLSKEDQVLQWISRFTLQAPQTQAGYTASQGRNLFGGVDNVEFFDGATLVNRNNPKGGGGMTLSPFILGTNLEASITDKTFMHEYGHTIQSGKWGPLYLPIPALFSGIDELTVGENPWPLNAKYKWHDIRWYERQAKKYASIYFQENYNVEWNEERNPIRIPLKYCHRERPSTLTIRKY